MSLITDGWTQSCELTLDNTDVDSPLTDFPVFISEATTGWPAGIHSGDKRAASDGADVRFAIDSAGVTEIPRDFLRWDNSLSEARLFVKVPNVASSSTTKIYMFWGNTNATAPARTDSNGSEAVWRSEYALVAHQNESSGSAVDETSNNVSGTYEGSGFPRPVSGDLDISQDYIAINDNRIDWGDQSQYYITGPISLGMITSIDGFGTAHNIISKRGATAPFEGYNVKTNTSGQLVWAVDFGANIIQITTVNPLNTTQTYWVVVTWDHTDANGMKIFVDGVEQSVTIDFNTTGADPTNSNPLAFGSIHGNDPQDDMNGPMEEGFIYQGELSAAWVKAQHSNQSDVANFVSAGSVQDHNVFPTDWSRGKKIVRKSKTDFIDSSLTGFWALIDEKQVDADFWASIQDGGGSIRCSLNEDGSNQLPVEVVECNTSTEKLQLWVNLNLSNTFRQKIFIWYKGHNTVYQPYPDNTYGTHKVWSPHSAVGIWHGQESETPGTTTAVDAYKDSSEKENHGQGDLAPTQIDGIVGKGQQGNGTNRRIVFGTTDLPLGSSERTVWGWGNFTDSSFQSLMGYGTAGSNGTKLVLRHESRGVGVAFGNHFWGKASLETGWTMIIVRIPNGSVNTDDAEVFINGLPISATTLSGSVQTLNTASPGFSQLLRGTNGAYSSVEEDEWGISSEALPDEFIKLMYYNAVDTDNLWEGVVDTDLHGNFNPSFNGGYE